MPDLGELITELKTGDAERAEAAVRTLTDADTKDILPLLAELLQHPDSEARWWAARALAEVDNPAAGNLLASALADPDESVRQCAALSLRQRPHPEAVPALTKMLASGEALTARLAADALIATGEEATETLIEVLQGQNGASQVEAARALALIGDTRAIGPLFQALDSSSVMVVHWASEGPERMGLGMRFFSPGG